MNSSVSALAFSCIVFPIIFLSVILELIIGYNGILNLFNRHAGKFPLAPLMFVITGLILSMIFIPMRYIKIQDRVAIKRVAITKMKHVHRYYSFAFIAFCGLLTLMTIVIIVGYAILF